ncbi:hypothetical protein QBC32DRAFT_371252 [Pseudoneurospora amorphoporcata]|uniref:Uncharacterized protein n=1 Tax=Pseudoneurospora amorphoporcata TaxID=241081 RepID=A0AAN6SEJ1_9PEZI|nr:hypothetical protein QBC32DRAFT_371252 [Pseudoneurospora amorphoporcata]
MHVGVSPRPRQRPNQKLLPLLLNYNKYALTRTGTSNCYVDQASSCDEPNAVPCTNLQKGVSKACCPRLTSCSDQYEATEEFVRCNIQYDDLFHPAVVVTATISESGKLSTVTLGPLSSSTTRAAGAVTMQPSALPNPEGSQGASAGSASTPLPGIPVPSSTASSIPAVPSPTPDSSPSISTAAIAGICVSATLACALLAVLIWIVLRRRRKAAVTEKAAGPSDGGNPGGSGSDQDTTSRDLGSPPDYLAELPHDSTRFEAPGDTRPYSYVVGQNGAEYYKPMELMTERVVPVELQGNTQRGMPPGQWQDQQQHQYGPFEIMTNPRGSGVIQGTPRAELAVPTPRAELGTFI